MCVSLTLSISKIFPSNQSPLQAFYDEIPKRIVVRMGLQEVTPKYFIKTEETQHQRIPANSRVSCTSPTSTISNFLKFVPTPNIWEYTIDIGEYTIDIGEYTIDTGDSWNWPHKKLGSFAKRMWDITILSHQTFKRKTTKISSWYRSGSKLP